MVATTKSGTITQFRQIVIRKKTHEIIPITKLAVALPLVGVDVGNCGV
jgi:hypothetical protein